MFKKKKLYKTSFNITEGLSKILQPKLKLRLIFTEEEGGLGQLVANEIRLSRIAFNKILIQNSGGKSNPKKPRRPIACST
jgi:hypothetical protein